MDWHLFGVPNGLPLSNLQAYIEDFGGFNDTPSRTQQWSAKIVDDELFLSAVHKSVLYEDSVAAFRNVDKYRTICPHIMTVVPWYLLGEETSELKGLNHDQADAPLSHVEFCELALNVLRISKSQLRGFEYATVKA